MTIPTLSTLPVAPARTDPPATFVTRADAFLAAIVTFQGEMNTSIGAMNTDIAGVNADATAAAASATAAAGSATAAANAAGAALWVSGQAYAEGDAAISGVNYQTYRAETTTSGTTDPSADANWTKISGSLPDQSGNADYFLTTDGTDASWVPLSASPTLQATASGVLANGDLVIINADGTVSAVLEESATYNMGADSIFESGTTNFTRSAYDSNANKIVVAYMDDSDGSSGTAVVGTVSGETITFGTPVKFSNGIYTDRIGIAFDSSANKVLIAYRASSNGKAIVGTVSGTTISFGSEATFLAGNAYENTLAFDPVANRFALFYEDTINFNQLTCRVATISGTSVSFGTAVIVDENPDYVSATFDSSSGQVAVVYKDTQNGSYGTCTLGTISGTNITFGTPVVFRSATCNFTSIAYDAIQNKLLVAYQDNNAGGVGRANVGTVSGTSTSWGSEVTFNSTSSEQIVANYDATAERVVIGYIENASNDRFRVVVVTISGTTPSYSTEYTIHNTYSDYPSLVYDANSARTVALYTDKVNSNYGTANVIRVPFTKQNLTAENYIGISDDAYSDGATATVQIIGSVDDAQSGLTAAQKYYVQNDNTLSLSPDSPSVFAGTAVSATKIIIKG